MREQNPPPSTDIDPKSTDPPDLDDRLYERYAGDLHDTEFTEAEKRELLLLINLVMQSFVDLGFSIAPGTTFSEDNRDGKSDPGFDDVLSYIFTERCGASDGETSPTSGTTINDKSEEKSP